MADVYNFDGYQIPHVGLTADLGGVGGQQNRALDSRMSNFGALRFGARGSTISGTVGNGDYTTIAYSESRIENPDVPTWATDNQKNPYTTVSGVNARFRIKNDEFTVMGIGNRRSNTATDAPKFDVTDTNLAIDDGTNAPKSFPNEGWRTFGGRTTGHAYTIPGYQPDVDMTLTASGTVMPA